MPCSHEAVRLWVKKLERVTVNVEAKSRRMIAIAETKIKADGEWYYVWAAIDVDTIREGYSAGRGTYSMSRRSLPEEGAGDMREQAHHPR